MRIQVCYSRVTVQKMWTNTNDITKVKHFDEHYNSEMTALSTSILGACLSSTVVYVDELIIGTDENIE